MRTASIGDGAGPNQPTQDKRAFVLLGKKATHDFFSNPGIFAIRRRAHVVPEQNFLNPPSARNAWRFTNH
jgi:hypothetical protein